jgi:photosystem II stability/assembly factor-like uncharacterized protein
MKRTTALLALFLLGLLLISLWGGAASSFANGEKRKSPARESRSRAEERKTSGNGKGSSRENHRSPAGGNLFGTSAQKNDEEDGDDPDMPPGARGKISEADYLVAREQFVARLRGMDPARPFDPRARSRAIQHMEQQEAQRPAKYGLTANGAVGPTSGPSWLELGPNPIPDGQTSPSNPVSGRVSAIEVDPTDPNKVYAGAAQGGVYRSLDGGANWTPIFDSAQTLAIGSLTLDAANGRLWVGTGESNGSLDCAAGIGLYRIENVNTTADLFGPISPPITNGITYNAFNGRSISKILIVPGDPNTLLVGAAGGTIGIGGSSPLGNTIPPLGLRGLYKLTNATGAPASVVATRIGVSPNPTVVGNNCFDSPCTGNRNVTDMVFDLSDPTGNTLVVWLNGTAVAGDGGIYRSTNVLSGSPTFAQPFVSTAPSTSNARGIFAVVQRAPSPALIYEASGESASGTLCTSTTQLGALRRSTDGGQTWSAKLNGGGGFCGGQCFYNIGIDVVAGATTASDKILLGGNISSTSCQKLQSTSLDGGNTAFAGIANSGVHADTHVIKIAPSNTNIVYRGDDGGIFKSVDGGNTWSSLNHSGFRATQFQSIALHPIDRNFSIGGTQDNGTLRLVTGTVWNTSEGGDGGYALIDQNAVNNTSVTMYHTFFNLTGTGIGFSRTTAAGDDSWPSNHGCGSNYTSNGITCTDAVNFYAPMALGPGNPNTLYFGTDRLYRSIDTGLAMPLVSQGPLAGGVPISAIGISPQADGYRLVGFDNGGLFYTTTASSTLTSLSLSSAGSTIINPYVARVVFDPNNKRTAFMTLGNYAGGTAANQSHVWKVTNLDTTPVLIPINGSGGNILPDVPVNAFAVDPLNSNYLYAGTDIGVYNSTDGGANWSPYGTGLPRVAVFDMAIQGPNRVLRIATHGRGMWETSIVSPAPSTVQFSGPPSIGVTEAQASVTITVIRTGDISFPASVNYATSDTAGSTNCGAASTGVASSRCDYVSKAGTINFAANETSKDILIPLIDDSYAEGNESFTINLSGAAGSGVTLGSPSTITITINDSGDAGGANPIDTTNFFVREQYIDFFSREPDTSGFNFWTSQINSCGSDQACIRLRRINGSAAFFVSVEFQNSGYLVERLYKAAYGEADGNSTSGGAHTLKVPIVRLSEFMPDTQAIGRGVIVNAPGWDTLLESNKQALIDDFVQRSRFTTAYPSNMTALNFVNTLNTNAGGVLSTAERDQLVTDLNSGAKTRAQVLRAVAEDPDLYSAEFNRAFVLMQYYGYLRRNPNDAPEALLDYSGYDFWLKKLNAFSGNYVNAQMVQAFLDSDEYRRRFGTL